MIRRLPLVVFLLTAVSFGAEFNGGWLKKVPPREQQKNNPYENHADAVASGRQVFLQHCSHCHGENAEGNKKHPSLVSARIQQQATPGELHYLLVNGSMAKGMPPWSKLGDPQIWQVVTYLKSLH
jgi:mono/diheme cytochrome c family protein